MPVYASKANGSSASELVAMADQATYSIRRRVMTPRDLDTGRLRMVRERHKLETRARDRMARERHELEKRTS